MGGHRTLYVNENLMKNSISDVLV